MKYYYSSENNGFYTSEIHGGKLPKDCQEVSKLAYQELLKGQSQGKQITANEEGLPFLIDPPTVALNITERRWRDSELARSDIELYKVQDSDPKSVGSVSQWREHRKALRSWPEHKDFPNKEFRPVAPDV